MSELHEPFDSLPKEVLDCRRALSSLREEVEAVDWYNQRAVNATDPELKAILEHNRDEEIEHASMVLEWLRRNMPAWDRHLRTYLFQNQPITSVEEETTGKAKKGGSSGGSLGIGTMR